MYPVGSRNLFYIFCVLKKKILPQAAVDFHLGNLVTAVLLSNWTQQLLAVVITNSLC